LDKPSTVMPWGTLIPDSSQVVYSAPSDQASTTKPPSNSSGVVLADHTGDGQITVLALSGGGSYGPFGAGVLAGWSATGTRIEADVVTGVSAGALLATYAFLGADFDGAAAETYSQITSEKVYKRRSLIQVPFSSSLADQGPLRDLLSDKINDALLDRVAGQFRDRGRRLIVASTDLDNGRVVAWDLTAIASSGRPDRQRIYVDALMASSAIPGFFQPVMISPQPDLLNQNRQLHVDGSVSTSIFVPPMSGIDRRVPLKVYAVVSSKMMEEIGPEVLRPTALDITAAALKKVLRTVLQRSVYSIFMSTEIAGGQFYLIGIPESTVIDTPQYEFTPALSQSLYALGKTLGEQSTWRTEPPRFDSMITQVPLEDIVPRVSPTR
jgi:predicted acylesterase/phospholipase RssA